MILPPWVRLSLTAGCRGEPSLSARCARRGWGCLGCLGGRALLGRGAGAFVIPSAERQRTSSSSSDHRMMPVHFSDRNQDEKFTNPMLLAKNQLKIYGRNNPPSPLTLRGLIRTLHRSLPIPNSLPPLDPRGQQSRGAACLIAGYTTSF